jgi:hypothetical protein
MGRCAIAGLLLAASIFSMDATPAKNSRGGGGAGMKKSIGAKTIVFPTPVFVVGKYLGAAFSEGKKIGK